jgi:opacity protein-like surface antigen
MKKLLIAVAASIAALSAPLVHAREIYGQVGTEGVGIGYSEPLGTHDNVRAEFNGISFSHSFDAGQLHYDGTAHIYHGGLYLDFFPAPSTIGFRLTAGALIGGDHVDATATSLTTTYTYHGTTYSTLGENIRAKARFPTVRPYIGIGFGHTPVAAKGFSAFFDAGVAYGRPTIDQFDVPANIVAAVGQAAVDQQKQDLQDKADKLRFYPIVKVGVTYRF